ncbi:MAG TPA: hypothetical protein VJU78_16075, partial [Chitinophagaceae bacterium]|nr:hypothetical protein [Chitinophagaceae bacterium]
RMTLMKSLVPGIYTWTFFVPAGITGAGVNIKYSKYETSDPIVNSGHTVHNALFGGGLRVKKIADYPHVSAIPKVRKYNYHYELNGNWYSYGRSMSKPNYSYFIEHTGIAGYNPITDHEIIAFSNVLMRESDSNIPLNGSAGGNTVGYDKVEEVIGENGENGKTVYEYQNQPDVIFNYTHTKHVLGQLTNIPRKAPFGGTVSNPGNGNLLKQIDYVFKDGGYTPVKEVTNTYQDLILAASSAAVIGIEKRAGSGHNPFVDPPACYVTSYVYPAITENRYVLTATTSKINDVTGATNPIITITEYTYDNSTHLQLTAISEYKSNGDKITTTFKYPEDFPDVQSDAANLLMKGTAYMHAVPVTQQLSITKGANQFLTEAQINRYQVLNGKVFPKEKAILEIVQPININTPPPSYNPASGTFPSNYKARLFFDSYDGNGNITQVHKSDEASLTYIWDYFSSYPVAEATNATTSTCAFTSFEADGPGNWIFSGTSVNDLSSFTGKKTYTLNGSNDITKSGLDAGKTYIVSYWSKTGSATINGAVAVAGMNRLGWTYYEHILSASTTSIIVTGNVTIDELRLFPKGSLMTSYTYEPLIGMTSQCDANNRVTYYGYDVFGRLKDIKDQDGSIIKTIDYNYKQP